MTQRTHYEGCWRYHLECAIIRVEKLEEFVRIVATKLGALKYAPKQARKLLGIKELPSAD